MYEDFCGSFYVAKKVNVQNGNILLSVLRFQVFGGGGGVLDMPLIYLEVKTEPK